MRYFKILTLITSLLFLNSHVSFGQSLEEILKKHFTAMGGVDKIKGVKTQYLEGQVSTQGQEMPFKRWVEHNKAMRMEFDVMGTQNIQVVRGDSGWMQMPVMGQTSPQDMDANTLKVMKGQLDISGSELYDYAAKGKKVALMGKDTVNGKPAFKLKVTNKEGKDGYAYIDAGSYYIVKTTNTLNVQGKDMELVTELSDYKKNAEGYVYPGTTSQGPMGVIVTVQRLDVNKPVADTLFNKPQQ
ncbi:LolA family protein [Chitinophaga vietnamensis]|uniref:LolA family protein n=1 Tax=Chitinophaga vietnamensis TaxID=2593957 RepID=UPI001177C4D8|nr:outer membrane lipoprotein-sorting protein [Chitinophaga vietnamensis]